MSNSVKIQDIYSYFSENKFYPDEIFIEHDVLSKKDSILVEISWGDWKFGHLRCDFLMRELGFCKIDEVVTEEDGSDTYSSIHSYEKMEAINAV